jgi:hypothetical protein
VDSSRWVTVDKELAGASEQWNWFRAYGEQEGGGARWCEYQCSVKQGLHPVKSIGHQQYLWGGNESNHQAYTFLDISISVGMRCRDRAASSKISRSSSSGRVVDMLPVDKHASRF